MKTVRFLGIILIFSVIACKQGTQQSSDPCCKVVGKDSAVKEVKDSVLVNKQLNDIALFVAGLDVDSSSNLFALSKSEAWKKYKSDMEVAWGKFNQVGDKIKEWKNLQISATNDSIQTLFYPFGGPDYLFANIFFPNATNYILIGLENPGNVPTIAKTSTDSLKDDLTLYKTAIEDVIQLSFFRTLDMNNELKTKAIDGTTPLIMLFLARSGKQMVSVTPLNLDESGALVPVKGKNEKHMAVEIGFITPGSSKVCKVTYLSTNLADPSLSKDKGFMAFLNNIDPNAYAFVKSATYLMHKNYFSIIRNTVLDKAKLLLQDDSGIAYKFFDKSKWNITLYGVYEKPIPLFKDFYEEDLSDAYKKGSIPITFRYGYNRKSSMLLAKKK